jgi:hypothetical protein
MRSYTILFTPPCNMDLGAKKRGGWSYFAYHYGCNCYYEYWYLDGLFLDFHIR